MTQRKFPTINLLDEIEKTTPETLKWMVEILSGRTLLSGASVKASFAGAVEGQDKDTPADNSQTLVIGCKM